jgi:hypothetical protein
MKLPGLHLQEQVDARRVTLRSDTISNSNPLHVGLAHRYPAYDQPPHQPRRPPRLTIWLCAYKARFQQSQLWKPNRLVQKLACPPEYAAPLIGAKSRARASPGGLVVNSSTSTQSIMSSGTPRSGLATENSRDSGGGVSTINHREPRSPAPSHWDAAMGIGRMLD